MNSSTTHDTSKDSILSLPHPEVSNPPGEGLSDHTEPPKPMKPATTTPLSDVWVRAKDISFTGHAELSPLGRKPAINASAAGIFGLRKIASEIGGQFKKDPSSDIAPFTFNTVPAPPPLIKSYVNQASLSLAGSSTNDKVPFKFEGHATSDSSSEIPAFNFNIPQMPSLTTKHNDDQGPSLLTGGSTSNNVVWETNSRLMHSFPLRGPKQNQTSAAGNKRLDFDITLLSLSDSEDHSPSVHDEQQSSIEAQGKEREGTNDQAGYVFAEFFFPCQALTRSFKT